MAMGLPQAMLEDYLMSKSVMDQPRTPVQRVLDAVFGRTAPERMTNFAAGVGGPAMVRVAAPMAGRAFGDEAASRLVRSVLEGRLTGEGATRFSFFPPVISQFLKRHPEELKVYFSQPNLGMSMAYGQKPAFLNPPYGNEATFASPFAETGAHIFPSVLAADPIAGKYPTLYTKNALAHELVHAAENLAGSPIPFPGIEPTKHATKYIGNDPLEWLAWLLYPPKIGPNYSHGGGYKFVDVVNAPLHREAVNEFFRQPYKTGRWYTGGK